MTKIRAFCSTTCVLALMAPIASAHAQESPSAPEAAASPAEIVVTAQRREERLQDVPISVTALSQDFLESRQITSIDNIGSLAPNIKITSPPGLGSAAQIAIRGSVTINPALYWEPAVALYLDGVYIGKTQGAVFDVADLARVEVLRGPQGTLYGRNALAGAVNLVTTPPKGEWRGQLRATAGNYSARSLRGSLDLPAFGPFSVKLSGSINRRAGMIDVIGNPLPAVVLAQPPQADKLQGLHSDSFRAAVRFAPSADFTADYAYDYSKTDQPARYGQLTRIAPGGIFDPASPYYVAAFPANLYVEQDRQNTAAINAVSRDRSRVEGHALTLEWTPADAMTVKSITAYRTLRTYQAGDYDGTPLPIVQAGAFGRYHAFSQELQILGSSGPLRYVAGLYYFSDKGSSETDLSLGPQAFGYVTNYNWYRFRTHNGAAYAQIDYDITDRITLTGGLRYTKEKKRLDRESTAISPVTAVVIPDGTTASKTFDNFSPTVILAYKPSGNLNLYAKYAQGFKSGGFNAEAQTVAATVTPFRPEKMDSFEVGAKAQMFDRRLTVNTALFYNRSSDIQLARFAGGTALGTVITNAGRANVWGIEIDAMARPTGRLTLRATYGYLHARYGRFEDYDEFTGTVHDVGNDRVFPLAPKNTASGSVDWIAWQNGDGVQLRTAVDADYSDGYYLYPYSRNPLAGQSAINNRADSRLLINGRISLGGLKQGRGEMELALWGRNLTNRKYVQSTLDLGAQLGGLRLSYYGDPRTYGIEAIVRW
ncbi:TonB-dependent receptor [Novosphingobium naphthalenivorans]|uniref:TonB-dependent receptor n=1 Tax=Novosphingobium naphthalenivorans TaxID=273168 RepID=UPI0008328101|nr:TonB-dependent receptor [Novosphingobium naphthalenivorans]